MYYYIVVVKKFRGENMSKEGKRDLNELVKNESERPEVKKEMKKYSWISNYDLALFI
ncbi:hypothetical protein JW949_03425 [Candidatus Woesearchaeota archaeon]|nr:hypothetical protein [Candidatus Woesearchaeota archaeon]